MKFIYLNFPFPNEQEAWKKLLSSNNAFSRNMYLNFAKKFWKENCYYIDIFNPYSNLLEEIQSLWFWEHGKFIAYIKLLCFLWKNRKDSVVIFNGLWPQTSFFSFLSIRYKVLWRHNTFLSDTKSLRRSLKIAIQKFIQWNFDFIFYMNEADKKENVTLWYQGKFHYMPIPINTEFWWKAFSSKEKEEFAQKYNKDSKAIWITTIARIERVKNVESLVRTLAILVHEKGIKNIRVNVIGVDQYEREWREPFQNYIQQYNVSNFITLHGEKNHEEIREILAITDIYTQPSYTEWHSRTLMEASCQGLPVCLSDIPSFRISYDGYAKFHETNDDQTYAENLGFYISDPNIRLQDGETIRKYVHESFSLTTFNTQIDEFIKKLSP